MCRIRSQIPTDQKPRTGMTAALLIPSHRLNATPSDQNLRYVAGAKAAVDDSSLAYSSLKNAVSGQLSGAAICEKTPRTPIGFHGIVCKSVQDGEQTEFTFQRLAARSLADETRTRDVPTQAKFESRQPAVADDNLSQAPLAIL